MEKDKRVTTGRGLWYSKGLFFAFCLVALSVFRGKGGGREGKVQRFIFYGGLAREGGKARVVRARGKNRGSYSIAWEDGEESAQRPDIYLHFLLPDPPSAEPGVDFPRRNRNRGERKHIDPSFALWLFIKFAPDRHKPFWHKIPNYPPGHTCIIRSPT